MSVKDRAWRAWGYGSLVLILAGAVVEAGFDNYWLLAVGIASLFTFALSVLFASFGLRR